MKKLIAMLVAALFAGATFAQATPATPAQPATPAAPAAPAAKAEPKAEKPAADTTKKAKSDKKKSSKKSTKTDTKPREQDPSRRWWDVKGKECAARMRSRNVCIVSASAWSVSGGRFASTDS